MKKLFALLILGIFCLSFLPLAQAQNCLSSRLAVGGQAVVTPGSANRIRSDASTSASQVGEIPAGGVFTLLEGPRCVDGFLWWRVDYSGTTGWTVEANGSDYFVNPVDANATQAPSGADGSTCSLAARLRVNGLGRTSSNTPVRIRSAAGSSNNQIGQIDPIDTFSVLAGPVCVQSLNWWQIRVGDTTGWIAEGSGSDYFVELIANTATPTPSRTPFPTSIPTATRTPTVTFTPTITLTPSVTPTQTPTGFANAYALAWNSEGTRLAVAGSEGVFIYNAEDWTAYPELLDDIESDALAFSTTDPNILVVNSTSDDFLWRVYDVSTGELIAEDTGINRTIEGLVLAGNFSFSEDGTTMAYTDYSLQIVSTENWERLDSAPLRMSEDRPVLAFQYTDEMTQAVEIVGNGNTPYVVTFLSSPVEILLDRDIRQQPITAAAFSPDTQFVVVGDDTGSLQMWNIATQERSSFIRDEGGVSQSNYINDIAFRPNGLELVTAESNPQGIVRVFQTDGLEQLENYGLNGGYLAAIDLAYSPDGEILAVIMDNYIHLLETEDYTLIQVLVQRP